YRRLVALAHALLDGSARREDQTELAEAVLHLAAAAALRPVLGHAQIHDAAAAVCQSVDDCPDSDSVEEAAREAVDHRLTVAAYGWPHLTPDQRRAAIHLVVRRATLLGVFAGRVTAELAAAMAPVV